MGTQLTWRQCLVLDALDRSTMPLTVAEIAQALNAPASSVRGALMALSRRGLVVVTGVALSGGQAWGRPTVEVPF